MAAVLPARKLTSWWGLRLQESYPLYVDSKKDLARGYYYRRYDLPFLAREAFSEARHGCVQEPRIEGSRFSARVDILETGGPAFPWIQIESFDDRTWRAVFAGIAARSQLLAELLSGHLPVDLRGVFLGAKVDLFPMQKGELVGGCDCNFEHPCCHLLALHYVLADAFDKDPFVLMELRGRRRDQLLSGVHAARRGAPAETTGVTLSTVDDARYDALPARLPELFDAPELPDDPAANVRKLRIPQGWSEQVPPADLLAPAMEVAARQARKLLCEPEKIRSLSFSPRPVDPRIERAKLLLGEQRAVRVLPALTCLVLAERGLDPEAPGEIVEDFHALLANPKERSGHWWRRWVPAVLHQRTRVPLALVSCSVGELLVSSLLTAEASPSLLLWNVEKPGEKERSRIKARRGLLEQLNTLLPEDVELALLVDTALGGEDLEEYLDVLGWTALPPDTHEAPSLPWGTSLLPEGSWRCTPAEAEQLFWLLSVVMELDRLLGDAPGSADQPGPPRGQRCFASFGEERNALLQKRLRSLADRLHTHPVFSSLFAPW